AAPFTAIRIGDVDGFGYGTGAGFTAANGGPANIGAGGVLGAEALPTIGDYLPDLNGDGTVQINQGDDFDNRSAAEVAGSSLSGSGFTDTGTTGSQFTDISLSQSYDTSSAANRVYDANTDSFGAGGAFPTSPSNTLPNQPGFVFDFFVADADIAAGTPVFFNMLFGDYDIIPAEIRFTFEDTSTRTIAVTTQNSPAGEDGLIQSAFAALDFVDVFTAALVGPSGWDGFLGVDFVAPNEPYTAFDFVELSVTPITPNPVPVPAAIWLFGTALIGLVGFSKRKKAA
ncbi:MAG: VPLPA-CTERM sorting domain-containing protein, partial [Gammaproteobacteria bacterium]|nr:VPLPA-CTERM sorting domain-containing protein [Gammaproteobacteria bacterium]